MVAFAEWRGPIGTDEHVELAYGLRAVVRTDTRRRARLTVSFIVLVPVSLRPMRRTVTRVGTPTG